MPTNLDVGAVHHRRGSSDSGRARLLFMLLWWLLRPHIYLLFCPFLISCFSSASMFEVWSSEKMRSGISSRRSGCRRFIRCGYLSARTVCWTPVERARTLAGRSRLRRATAAHHRYASWDTSDRGRLQSSRRNIRLSFARPVLSSSFPSFALNTACPGTIRSGIAHPEVHSDRARPP